LIFQHHCDKYQHFFSGWSKKRQDDETDDGTPGGRYATGHYPVVVYVQRTHDTAPWRCSSDGTDDETRLIARGYVVRHHIFNLKLTFVHH